MSKPTPAASTPTTSLDSRILPTATGAVKEADRGTLEVVFEVKGDTIGPLQGVALDPQGNVFVAQNRSGSDPRIYKFDPSGKLIASWGSKGAREGEFSLPPYAGGAGGVATDTEGNVYVTDVGNARVQKFDNNGKFLAQWGSQGEGDGQFSDPFGIAVSKQGFVYVSEYTHNLVQKFDTNGKFLSKWAQTSRAGGQPQQSGWLATDDEGNVYVPLYSQAALEKFSPDGKLLAEFPNKPVNGKFVGLFAVAVDQAGNIYSTDANSNRIIKYDKAGAVLAAWDKTTAKTQSFSNPTGVAVDAKGNIYVAENAGRRLQKLRQP
ncbi:MAG: 6-bladed beta-propeller [Chloroflexota bacterium]